MAKDLVDGEVDEIPVVGLLGILEIERENLVTSTDGLSVIFKALCCQFLELRHEY